MSQEHDAVRNWCYVVNPSHYAELVAAMTPEQFKSSVCRDGVLHIFGRPLLKSPHVPMMTVLSPLK